MMGLRRALLALASLALGSWAQVVPDPRLSECYVAAASLSRCMQHESAARCVQMHEREVQGCVAQVNAALSDCRQNATPPAQCLGPEIDALRQAIIKRMEQRITNQCEADWVALLRTTEGLETLLASGRVLLSLGLTLELMIEAGKTGQIPSFVIGGHVASFGDADACHAIPGQHYCWISPTMLPTDRAGFCAPASCSLADVAEIANSLIHSPIITAAAASANTTLPNVTFDNLVGYCGPYKFKPTAGTYIMTVVIALLVVLVLAGTYVEYAEKRREEESMAQHAIDASNDYKPLDNGEEDETKAPLQDIVDEENGQSIKEPLLPLPTPKKVKRSLACKVVECFSLYRTWHSLTQAARPGDFNALDGIRVFSMFWVVMGHLLAFPSSLVSFSNADAVLPPNGIMATYSGQAIIAGEFAVDSFFTIGAFLAAYLLLQFVAKALKPADRLSTEAKPLGWKWLPMLYVHRWLRLTPSYFFVVLFYVNIMRVLNKGPFWGLLSRDFDNCTKYWWSNLFYLNTIVPNDVNKMCYAVSWYMSVDFLLFLFLPFLVLAFALNRRVGYTLPLVLWTASVAYSWQLAYRQNMLEFDLFSGLGMNAYMKDYYFRFWTRCPVYLIGMVTAFLWYDVKARHAQPTQTPARVFKETWQIVLGFLLAFFLLGSVVYGAQPAFEPPGFPAWLDHWYLAMSRSAWAVGLCLLCWLVFEGHGGPIKWLLENRVTAVLSRLTFLAYLIHPAAMFMIFLDDSMPAHYSNIWYGYNLIGMLSLVFLLSALVFLLVEKPMANLERLLLGQRKKSE